MNTHPIVEITGGDLYLHDLFLYDEAGELLSGFNTHTFSTKIRTMPEGDQIVVAATAAYLTEGVVRFTIPAASTATIAASYDRCVYAIRDDTLQITLLTVEATVTKGVAS